MAKKAGLKGNVKVPKMQGNRIFGAETGFISVFKQEAFEGANRTLEKLAKQYVKNVIEAIDSQAYNWAPLSEKYAAYKDKHDLDPRIYIATGFFKEHITVWKDADGRIHAGLRPNVRHPDNGMRLVDLARIHEYGRGNNPARPLWRTALALTLQANKRFAQQYRRHVSRKLGGAL